MNKYIWTLAIGLLICFSGLSQVTEEPLMISVEQAELYKKERGFEEREPSQFRDGGIVLPFIDDFSRYSLPTSDTEIPEEWQMWTDNSARLNTALVLNPPSLGAATLEGLDRTGFPYSGFNSDNQGYSDTLTSCPIDLSGKLASDSVKLVFYYQEGGLGDPPTASETPGGTVDSLLVQFLIPGANPPLWQTAWATAPNNTLDFQQVFIHIDNEQFFLQENFQFRFINYGRNGNVDHWHIDYVWLDEDIVDADFQIIDVSPNSHETSLLNTYNSIPWHHYQVAPSSVMMNNKLIGFSNLDDDRTISFGGEVYFEDGLISTLDQGISTGLNGFSTFTEPFSINDGTPNSFVYPTDIAEDCATFEIKYFASTSPDINAVNDTLVFEQHFGNYYAYDDGTAERAVSLNEGGAAMSMKYTSFAEDSLLGLLIHFVPFPESISNETFLIRAWSDAGGVPGAELTESLSTDQPDYYQDGYDIFEFYEYESPIHVPAGDFHVGFIQTTDARLHIGLDKHSNGNSSNFNVRLGPFDPWVDAPINGSVMIRPVFKSNKPLEWDFVSVEENKPDASQVNVFPNPTSDMLSSSEFISGRTVVFFNAVGEEVRREVLVNSEVSVGDFPAGIYIVQVLDNQSLVGMSKFIKD